MNCTVLQRRLLELEQPDRPPPEVRAHLAACAVCRRWQRRLVHIEQRVPLITVPPSGRKSAVLRRVLAEPAAAPKAAPHAEHPRFRPFAPAVQPRDRQKLRIAAITTLAAVLAVFALGLYSAKESSPPSPKANYSESLTARLVQHDLKLAAATKPSEKVKVLAALAEDLHRETCALAKAGSADDLKALAGFYQRVVGQGALVKQANKLSPGERPEILTHIVSQLQSTATDADALAGDVPAAAEPLRTIASAARDVEGQLRQLTGG
jgi:hypothetical protein